ncbi:Gfo/Idh/MocA family protein [Riemerella anatipestifer]|uniref:Oxidoreductase domain protein n=2 Tax=Riemerella anatipestifer TaxID=34085 RepID=E4T9E2_RIEAD|nr:Gfo/Idh/MocA family oxidoreductase [Riemerella anatipestifer]ADQ81623.1 oxidoreductase domain protein [Riemerella anatipestifer ATCC 11845 = DSM 15868]AFD55638.1 oxidoreductase domain protein [Riemerella anatipestifer ATCC 11845 = DSM 15868]AZZ57917.1 gfo/Idh/MocA family oxidoreductase [Riemerella anatipestifer]MBT0551271.1 Gfo/Idh/MocA family oxidoreductase [Riemerella anatipestifer]MBT0552873.1 Gfo/Idh/MocA family oxidoreductase [Riemerella anatipestifer]
MINAGLVGAGHLGKIHLRLLQQSEKYNLVGFYDADTENGKRLEAEFGYKYYPNFEDLLNDIEMLDIVTPTLFHYDYAQKAIDHGKHFFIEKPVTQTLEQAEDIIRRCTEKGIKAQVGHVERYNPAFIATKPYIQNPMFIEIHRLAEFNPRGTDVSVVLDLMIHDLDILLSLVKSKVKNIHASGVCIVSKTPDITNARIEFENGCVANLTTSRISMKAMRKSRFFQKDAYISVDFLEKKAEVIRMKDAPENPSDFDMIIENAEGEKSQIIFEYPNIQPNNAILDELESFAEAITNNKEVEVSLQDGTEALRVALEIMRLIS